MNFLPLLLIGAGGEPPAAWSNPVPRDPPPAWVASSGPPVAWTPPAPPKPADAPPKGWHRHRCPFDGTEWWHSHDSFGNPAAHQCPTCGRLVWHTAAPPAGTPAPVYAVPAFPGGCPGGVCPAPSYQVVPLRRYR